MAAEFDCPKENGFFPHPTSCDKYWKCEDGKATLTLCGNGLAFDDTDAKFQRENCDYIYNIDCGDRANIGTVHSFIYSFMQMSRQLFRKYANDPT